jgi:branched-chain amino acid transport system permease protein
MVDGEGFMIGVQPFRNFVGRIRPIHDQLDETSWLYRFIGFPILQMLIFVVAAALVMTVLAYFLAVLFPEPAPNIVLVTLLNRQLPGMIASGITIGFVYAMIALGYTLVYGVLKFINFAHSEIFMVGSVIAFEIMQRIDESGTLQQWNPLVIVVTMVIGAMIVSGLLAVVIERVAYRPLRGAPRLVPLISAIGVSLFLVDFIRAIMAITRNQFNLTYPKNDLPWLNIPAFTISFEGAVPVNIQWTRLIIILGAVLMLVALNYFVNGTKLGRGIRAVSQDQTTAALMGINVNRMIALTFFVGGALGGAAGALFGLNVGTITPTVGFIPGIKAFTAAVLGGIGNVPGALLGGLALGMIESFLNGVLGFFPALGKQYTDIFAFSVLILILIFRPSGILGERVDEKV